MSGIEWQETREYRPLNKSVGAFCQENGIPFVASRDSKVTLAFIGKAALDCLHDYLVADIGREHGGVFVGQPFYDAEQDRYFVMIHRSIPALETEGSPVHLQFVPETWADISGIIEDNYPDMVVVGWYHSHPGLDVFMSSTDRATQRAFFNHPWSLAVVVDPFTHKTGWFSGAECKPMAKEHVVVDDGKVRDAKTSGTSSTTEREYLDQYSLSKLGWLLPCIGILMIVALAGAWFLSRERLQTGIA
jgi:proteasome lid subunit RPN8/RPN11